MQVLHFGQKDPKHAPTSRGAGPVTRTIYTDGKGNPVGVDPIVEEIPAPNGETIRKNFDQAKRGPKPKQQFRKGVERGEASQRYDSNPW